MSGFTQMGADFFVSHRLHGLHGLFSAWCLVLSAEVLG
jgi:hypothetical protein